MPRLFYLPLVEPGVLLSLKATNKRKASLLRCLFLLSALRFLSYFHKRLISLLTSLLGSAIIMTRKLGKGGKLMNKEEILKASRKENKNKDLAEIEVMYQAGSHASRVGALACCLVSLLSSMLAHTMLYSPWIIYFSMIATQWLAEYWAGQ